MGVFNTRPRFDDTQIKQLTGDTITLSGTTNISGTFRYIPGATTGNFLKAADPQGTLEWAPISAITWAISACTSPLYVSTIEACPNPTDPLYIEAGEVQFGTSPNSIITDITNTRVGIGTGSPSVALDVQNGDILVENSNGMFETNLNDSAGALVRLTGDSSSLTRLAVSHPPSGGVAVGHRGSTEASFPGYGKQGDGFLYSSEDENGLNIISQPGTGTEDYIRFYAGDDANGTTANLYIQGSGSTKGNVGINTETPTEKLHIEGGDILVSDTNGFLSTDIGNSAGVNVNISAGTDTQLTRLTISDIDSGIAIGHRGISEATFTGYGAQGDGFLYSGNEENGLNIISRPGTGTDDYIRFFAGQAAGAAGTPDLYIQGSGSTRGNIGINNESPTEKLHIISAVEANIKVEADTGNVDETDNANILLTQDGGISTARFGMSPDGDNHLLIGVNSTAVPSIKFATRSDGTSFSTTADTKVTISNAGNVGIGTETPTEKLHVEGGNILVNNNLDGRAAVTIDNFSLGNDAFSTLRVCVSGSSLPACAYGVVSAYGPDASPTGSFGGSYLPNSLTIATSNNAQPDRLHINIGSRRAGDAQTRFFGGSDDFDSSSLLGVFYTSGLTITDTLNTDTLRVRDGATSGYVLTSDAQGNASWQPSTSGGTSGGVTIDPYNDVGTTTTINWDVSGTSTNYEATLNGNGTLNLLNVRNGDYGTIIVEQDGVGGHTLAFGTINGGAGTHKVVNGGSGAPTLTVNANAIDILSFTYNGSTMYWTVGNDYT